jgi:5-methylcytosine-specific restriction endonuclease McrA
MGRKTRGHLVRYCRSKKTKIGAPAVAGMSDILWRIGQRDAWICWICRTEVFAHETDVSRAPSKDHLIPSSHGGPSGLWNLRLAHFGCNEKRDDSLIPPSRKELLKYITFKTYPVLLERFARVYGYSFSAHEVPTGETDTVA